MTEKYIKVYQQRLKKEFKDKLLKSDATAIKDNLPEQEETFGDNKWVKTKLSLFLTKVTDVVSILIRCPPVLIRWLVKRALRKDIAET